MWETPVEETPRQQWRRRLQQRRCLVCGTRDLANRATSYFCATHIGTHRYCSRCETLRSTAEHGRDARCRSCASAYALARYHAQPDSTLYRICLRQIAARRQSRADQLMAALRRRIALADLVRATPGWTWRRRAGLVGGNATQLAASYRRQCAGALFDVDAADRARKRRRHDS